MIGVKRLILENLAAALSYWGISHLNWMVFSGVGVLPMPLWPAAALALVVALHRGWRIAPGVAAGVVLANHFSLGAPWSLALCISVMNTIGPVWGAILIKKRITDDLVVNNTNDFVLALLIGVGLVPLLTALGGIGSKFALGMQPSHALPFALGRWAMAHSLGTLLFALPYLIWADGRKKT